MSEKIPKQGQVVDSLPNTEYRILLENDQEVIGHLSGSMKQNNINVMTGDDVIIELSPYDLSRGIIVKRIDDDGDEDYNDFK